MPRLCLLAALTFLFSAITSITEAGEAKPNFVFFLVDDLGYMDISPNNPHTFYETPNLERLAQEGMRFTNGYAANPVCSPTRYSLMTGKYPTRVQATNFFAGKREGRFRPAPLNDRMPLSEVTLAEALKPQGYKTAFLGKWHLGPTEEFWPENQGFDINIGGFQRGLPPGGYFSPYKNPRLEDGPKGEHLTRRLTDEAINILDGVGDEPFLLYLSFYTVHTPLQAPKPLVEKYRRKASKLPNAVEFESEEQVWPTDSERKVRVIQNHPTYAAMVETMDTSIGRVLDHLEKLGLTDNTVICFTSDNGGLSTSEGSPTSNLPFRGGKGWVYEGGIREPFLIKWPGTTPAGSVCETPICSIDMHPTLCEIANAEATGLPERDGVSLVSLLQKPELTLDRPLFWHYPHYSNQGGFPGGAVRQGPWKLIERYEDGDCHLFNLEDDPGEKTDLASRFPGRVDELKQLLHAWYVDVDARFLEKREAEQAPWRP
ncbi:sulfatase [Rubinisphaera sp. JC750]|uniref:sulfatase n=1 Tax=Rubinisphaera sp. JC750 TaxID=2898658 RepID=UPI001F46922C|nr:sulfatase [Rubinisphaera sp. JC750]